MEPGSGLCRPRVPLVYLNSFGAHRCGTVIRYGRCAGAGAPRRSGEARRPEVEPPPPASRARHPPRAARSGGDGAQPAGPRRGDRREDKADTFDFPFPSRNVDKAMKRKKQKSKVWLRVWKVISKMLEENEKFRSRLLACRQCDGEGSAMKQSSQNEASYLDREESIFGWV
ncbi:uncharacterized protein C5orf47 homolog [Rhea pennata]|uniref:uncharacterized protein C5orf47 homolog n=1 Tax=Rhea pennata TaxID=8795 RepID=UPI002E264E78